MSFYTVLAAQLQMIAGADVTGARQSLFQGQAGQTVGATTVDLVLADFSQGPGPGAGESPLEWYAGVVVVSHRLDIAGGAASMFNGAAWGRWDGVATASVDAASGISQVATAPALLAAAFVAVGTKVVVRMTGIAAQTWKHTLFPTLPMGIG